MGIQMSSSRVVKKGDVFLLEVIQAWVRWIDTLSIHKIINPNDQI